MESFSLSTVPPSNNSLQLNAKPVEEFQKNENYNPTALDALMKRQGFIGNVRSPQTSVEVVNVDDLNAINTFPVSRSFTVQVVSAGAAGAVDTTIFLLNETSAGLNNAVTNNGSGANSISYTYPDGFGGRAISKLLSSGRLSMGLVCVAVSMRFTGTGLTSANALAAANAVFITNGFFSSSPQTNPFDMATRQFRPDQDTTIEAMPCLWNILATTQLRFLMPGDATNSRTANVTFYIGKN